MKTKHWNTLFAGLILLAALTQLLLNHFFREGRVATVYHRSIPIETIDLNRVDAPFRFTITGEEGAENVVFVEPGQISVESATCRDQICVHQGPITDGTRPIVCLPHQMVIQIRRSPDDPADIAVGG